MKHHSCASASGEEANLNDPWVVVDTDINIQTVEKYTAAVEDTLHVDEEDWEVPPKLNSAGHTEQLECNWSKIDPGTTFKTEGLDVHHVNSITGVNVNAALHADTNKSNKDAKLDTCVLGVKQLDVNALQLYKQLGKRRGNSASATIVSRESSSRNPFEEHANSKKALNPFAAAAHSNQSKGGKPPKLHVNDSMKLSAMRAPKGVSTSPLTATQQKSVPLDAASVTFQEKICQVKETTKNMKVVSGHGATAVRVTHHSTNGTERSLNPTRLVSPLKVDETLVGPAAISPLVAEVVHDELAPKPSGCSPVERTSNRKTPTIPSGQNSRSSKVTPVISTGCNYENSSCTNTLYHPVPRGSVVLQTAEHQPQDTVTHRHGAREQIGLSEQAKDQVLNALIGHAQCANHQQKLPTAVQHHLQTLQQKGIHYADHDMMYSLRYLWSVAPNGNCMFTSLATLCILDRLLRNREDADESDWSEALNRYSAESVEPTQTDGEAMSRIAWDILNGTLDAQAHSIRMGSVQMFRMHYRNQNAESRKYIDQDIRNHYFPNLDVGWGVQPSRTRRFLVRKQYRDELVERIQALVNEQHFGYSEAAEMVYRVWGIPVDNGEVYCDYMSIGVNSNSSYFIVSLTYHESGLSFVDDDPEGTRIAWGDDRILRACASYLEREIFVALVHSSTQVDTAPMFLPHKPLNGCDVDEAMLNLQPFQDQTRSKGLEPWFLLMIVNDGCDGDHYDPLLSKRFQAPSEVSQGSLSL